MKTYNSLDEFVQDEKKTIEQKSEEPYAFRDLEALGKYEEMVRMLGYEQGPFTKGNHPSFMADPQKGDKPTKDGWSELMTEEGGHVYKDGKHVASHYSCYRGLIWSGTLLLDDYRRFCCGNASEWTQIKDWTDNEYRTDKQA